MKFMRYYLLSLLLLCGLQTQSWAAADLCTTAVISQTDASNGSGTMPSWSGSAAPSTIDDAGRALQGAIAREYNWRNFTLTSAGTSTAYTLTYAVAPIAYCPGQIFSFIVDENNGGSSTVNVNTLGAVTVKKLVSGTLTNLAASDWLANDRVSLAYNATGPVLVWVNRGTVAAAPSGSITASGYTMNTARILGRTTASSGAIEEITVGSGLSLAAGSLTSTASGNPTVDVQTVTATGAGTWTKPSGGQTMCAVEVTGAGGSGGKGAAAAAGGGGGGGQHIRRFVVMSGLGATEALSIGAGGAAQTVASTDGNAGGNSTFGSAGTLITAYGGGPGMGTGSGGINGGGGGGGPNTAGAAQTQAITTNFNVPNEGAGGRFGSTSAGEQGKATLHNGAGGGGSSGDATNDNGAGGSSVYGGAGGGAAAEDVAPGPGAGGTSQFGGAGGAGAFDATAATAGSAPGGGGGGSETGTSGAGGDGKAIITCW